MAKINGFEVYDAKVCAPIKSGDYVALDKYGIQILSYSRKHNAWNCHDHQTEPTHQLFPDYWGNLHLTSEDVE